MLSSRIHKLTETFGISISLLRKLIKGMSRRTVIENLQLLGQCSAFFVSVNHNKRVSYR